MFDMWLTLVHEHKLYQFSDDISPLFGDIYAHQNKNYCTVIWRFKANNRYDNFYVYIFTFKKLFTTFTK